MTTPMTTTLADRINFAKAEAGNPLSKNDVAAIIETVLGTMDGHLSASNMKLFSELDELARYIETTKQELAALRADEIKDKDIPTATDELDAVVGATESATTKILDSCEAIGKVAATLPDGAKNELIACVTGIYEACSFQDITGQRITKVVRTLKKIDERVSSLLSAFGPEIEKMREASGSTETGATGDAALLNGPQLAAAAMNQDDIDALLAGL